MKSPVKLLFDANVEPPHAHSASVSKPEAVFLNSFFEHVPPINFGVSVAIFIISASVASSTHSFMVCGGMPWFVVTVVSHKPDFRLGRASAEAESGIPIRAGRVIRAVARRMASSPKIDRKVGLDVSGSCPR